ncbi:MAG: hypothetical protein ACR2NR_14125 [Solirubrobacteraceae bacterium]
MTAYASQTTGQLATYSLLLQNVDATARYTFAAELRVAEETHPKAHGQALVGLLHPIGSQHGCTAP